jgi:dihydrofolate reductase
MGLKAIVAIDEEYGIGKKGGLLLHNKEDMKFFKETTMGNIVIMGMNTFKSLPAPLKGRKNVVITRHKTEIEGVEICNNYLDLVNLDAFVIGGAQIYELFLPYCEELYITENEGIYGADVFFPKFDKSLYAEETLVEGDSFKIKKYTKIKPE